MKLSDLKLWQEIEHPTSGKGTVIELGRARTVTVKYKHSTRKTTFKKNNQEFELNEI